jgi:hypothetical protein
VGYWWRVTPGVVWRWRKALEVTTTSNASRLRVKKLAAKAGGAVIMAKAIDTPKQRDRKPLRKPPGKADELQGQWWTKQECKLFGRYSDAEVAQRTG